MISLSGPYIGLCCGLIYTRTQDTGIGRKVGEVPLETVLRTVLE